MKTTHHDDPSISGLEKDVKSLTDNTGRNGAASAVDDPDDLDSIPHVMLSYEWGCQQSVLLIKSELQKAGENCTVNIVL